MADQKPPRRIRDPQVLADFRALNLRCLACGDTPADPHHVLLKSRGGDDLMANLFPLCRRCHGAYHGSPYWKLTQDVPIHVDAGWIRFKTARWLESDEGTACRAYLVGKLGRPAAARFLHKEFGLRDEAA